MLHTSCMHPICTLYLHPPRSPAAGIPTISVGSGAKLSRRPFPAGGLYCLRFPQFHRAHTPATL